MNRRDLVATSAAFGAAAFGRAAFAQDDVVDCPEGSICVRYPASDPNGAVIEIDPSQGYLQVICVAEIVTTTTTFDGTTTTQQVKMADFVSNGDTYELREEKVEPRLGVLKDASLGDVFVLTEVTNG